ncbi:hypothetical protein Pst134EA_009675 [Puccinia striiformis f. sp. tritici]|uniref:hypothetical protein n=1 Tax=Puccinia striiformis f. sp. tritici TaxID=168172 RepID=UPI0020088628|nr:hypothetical protein Pst134EA_009675 [Puccinia striiformis f. sp. tritici]KAH9469146.1 hypothetical protein Pst134EA_009675 [Puccinia striiformis f. sp. tritici]
MAADVLDGATEYDMAYQLRAFVKKDVFVIIETLDGFDTYDWPKLKAAMISYWGRTDVARFTLRDLDSLVKSWTTKGGVLLLVIIRRSGKSGTQFSLILSATIILTLSRK